MSETPLDRQFEILRLRLDTALPQSTIIVVSSAEASDGKFITAAGLAASMNLTGLSTLLVQGDSEGQGIRTRPAAKSFSDLAKSRLQSFTYKIRDVGPDMLDVSGNQFRSEASREAVIALFASFKELYRYTVIEIATALSTSIAQLFASEADGVLLSIKDGRRVTNADHALAKEISRSKANLLGIVAVSRSLLKSEFGTSMTPPSTPKESSGETFAQDVVKRQRNRQVI